MIGAAGHAFWEDADTHCACNSNLQDERIGTDWNGLHMESATRCHLWLHFMIFQEVLQEIFSKSWCLGLGIPSGTVAPEQWTEAGKIRCNAPGHALWIKWAGNISGTMKQTGNKRHVNMMNLIQFYDEFMMNFWCSCSFLWVVLLFSLASWRETSGIARSLQAEQRLSEERLCPAPSPASTVHRQPSVPFSAVSRFFDFHLTTSRPTSRCGTPPIWWLGRSVDVYIIYI